MSAPAAFSTLLIENEVTARERFKQALQACQLLRGFACAPSLAAAQSRLADLQQFDIIFIARSFEQEAVRAFIAGNKSTISARNTAFVQMFAAGDYDASMLGDALLGGADGVLIEPYSAQSLTEVVQTVVNRRALDAADRERGAITLLVREVIDQLNLVAFLRSSGYSAAVSERSLREACSVLETLEPDSLARYYEVALQEFAAAPFPAELYQRRLYNGVSRRVRAKVEKWLQSDIQKRRRAKRLGNA